MSSNPPAQPETLLKNESRTSAPLHSSHPGKSWQQAEGLPETLAPLEQLPDGVIFGNDFPEPIHFDPQRRVLKYRGQMFHGNFTFLSSLSRDVRF